MSVEIEVYKAIERLEEKEKVNAMFVKSIVEQVEYMETYGLTVWNLFRAPLKGYKVIDNNNERYEFAAKGYIDHGDFNLTGIDVIKKGTH